MHGINVAVFASLNSLWGHKFCQQSSERKYYSLSVDYGSEHSHTCIFEVQWYCGVCTFLFIWKVTEVILTAQQFLSSLFTYLVWDNCSSQNPLPCHLLFPSCMYTTQLHVIPALVPVFMPLPLSLKSRLLQTVFTELVERLQGRRKNKNAQFLRLGCLR